MTQIGIYGYCFTKEFTFKGGTLIPRYKSFKERKENKYDGSEYVLSGFFSPAHASENTVTQIIYDLSAVLSFIEQKNVIISNFLEEHETPEKLDNNFPLKLKSKRKSSLGIIVEDCFSEKSRSAFIELAMDKLHRNINSHQNPFRTAFYKSIFSFRERMDYVDVKYFLNFSALESLCRYIDNESTSSYTPQIITKVLKDYGFNVSKEGNPVPQRNVIHYCTLRNSLFHNGNYIGYIKKDDPSSIIKLSDYYSNLNLLLPLVLMKYIGFDDGLINWDSWIDYEPFLALRPKNLTPSIGKQSIR
ncbi:hypothetical protein ACRFDE_003218 [Escherichia coli]